MASETASKRLKTSPPLIGTHSGHFHADEALAVYLLRLLPTYQPSTLVRTRDPNLLSTCHTVVDVGGEYDPPTNRYDHHQRTFTATFPRRNTKLSSAGLVYLHFGKEIIARRTGLSQDGEQVRVLWEKLYGDFIEALDAHDNGISAYDPAETKGLTKRFHDGGVSLGSIVGDLNNAYSDDEDDTPHSPASSPTNINPSPSSPAQDPNSTTIIPKDPSTPQSLEDARFLRASSLIGAVFLRKLRYCYRAWLPSRSVVHTAYVSLASLPSPLNQILILPHSVPWKDHLYTLEAETSSPQQPRSKSSPTRHSQHQTQQQPPPVLYVLYPEDSTAPQSTKWRVQAVGTNEGSFESRKPLPALWRGLRDRELDAVAGVEGCVFVHASGFIGGNASREGALEMARRAVKS